MNLMGIYTKKKLLWPLLLLLSFLGGFQTSWAEETSQEYQLKAAFLVNFARFITWPEQSFTPERPELIICVAGKNPFGNALSGVESKKIGGRNVRVVAVDSLKKVPRCHMLYVGKSEESDLDILPAIFSRQAVVVVSDISGFLKDGGSIEFVSKENRLSFAINNSALKQRGIQVGASLLDLAVLVQ